MKTVGLTAIKFIGPFLFLLLFLAVPRGALRGEVCCGMRHLFDADKFFIDVQYGAANSTSDVVLEYEKALVRSRIIAYVNSTSSDPNYRVIGLYQLDQAKKNEVQGTIRRLAFEGVESRRIGLEFSLQYRSLHIHNYPEDNAENFGFPLFYMYFLDGLKPSELVDNPLLSGAALGFRYGLIRHLHFSMEVYANNFGGVPTGYSGQVFYREAGGRVGLGINPG